MRTLRTLVPAAVAAVALVAICLHAAPQKPDKPAKTKPANAKKKAKKEADPWKQYKRVHRMPIRQMLEGESAKVLPQLQKLAADRPDDAETQYCLALAMTATGGLDEAVRHARQAVKLGLSVGRFFAGPRELTEPLVKTAAFRKLAEECKFTGLVHGPMLGCVTASEAKFWVRTAEESAVQVVLSDSPKLTAARTSAPVRTRKDRDYTAVAALAGLKADTTYYYDVLIDGKSTMGAKPWSLRTHPPRGAKAKFDVAFGGGAGFVPENEHVWDTVCKHNPRAFVFLGDNVYIDMPTSFGSQRYCYYRRQSRPEFARLTAQASCYAIWDDHDFGTNDCSGGPEINVPEWKIPVWKVFRNNWNNASYGGGEKQPGCWFDFSIADVDFFMTDGRYYRTPPRTTPKADRSMLGPVQKKWLLAKLKASRATFKVLCSGTPWTFFAKGNSQDTWNGFKKERSEIFGCIAKNKISGVVLLTADRHRHDVWKIPNPPSYEMYEFESSRMTNQHVHPTMARAEFSWNGHGFGLLSFDTTKADPEVTYRITSTDDKVIHTVTVKKSQLTAK